MFRRLALLGVQAWAARAFGVSIVVALVVAFVTLVCAVPIAWRDFLGGSANDRMTRLGCWARRMLSETRHTAEITRLSPAPAGPRLRVRLPVRYV